MEKEKIIHKWTEYEEEIEVLADLGKVLVVKSITYPNKEIHFVERRFTNLPLPQDS